MNSYSGQILPFLNLDFPLNRIILVSEQYHDGIIRSPFLCDIVIIQLREGNRYSLVYQQNHNLDLLENIRSYDLTKI